MIRIQEKGTIAGRVTDKSDGRPLYGADITVEGADIRVRTDVRGRFSITDLPTGVCVLSCGLSGYKPVSALRLKVESGQVTRCECQLIPQETIPLNEPIVLLPLRLEIRKQLSHPGKRVSIARYAFKNTGQSVATARRFAPFEVTSEFEFSDLTQSEYWIRWYPDDIHHLTPIGKITEPEKAAWSKFYQVYEKHQGLGSVKGLYAQDPYNLSLERLEIFYGSRPGRLTDDEIERCQKYDEAARGSISHEGKGVREALGWQDLENPEMQSAWTEFTLAFGPVRARQIAKHLLEGNWDFDTDLDEDDPMGILTDQGMPIPTLPEEVSLYTIKNRQIEHLVDRIGINRENLIIAPTDLEGSHWMTDFQIALKEGMGTIIKDPDKVKQIDQADWLIIVGLNQNPDSRKVFEEILRRHSANGETSILAQDSATNNTESGSTRYTGLETEAEAHLTKTRMTISAGNIAEDPIAQIAENTLDSQRLTSLFKLATSTLSQTPEAQLTEMTEATAMAALLWTPCTFLFERIWGRQFKNYFSMADRDIKGFSLGDFFIRNVRARGTLPILRVGDNPYGILPVISLRHWCTHITKNQYQPGSPLQIVCALINYFKDIFLRLSEDISKVDLTGDEIYEKFLEILRSAPVSKQVEVRPFLQDKPFDMGEDPKYLTCPLVKDKVADREASSQIPYPETAYLSDLSRVNRPDFNPGDFLIEADSPLLKRLIKYLLQLIFGEVKGSKDGTKGPAGFSSRPGEIKRAAAFGRTASAAPKAEIPGGLDLIASAGDYLKRVHPDKLEILLAETLDLFSHRLDAWLTGIANARLVECQRESTKPPPVGVFGWLEKPGSIDSTPPVPEFIQAPSVKQAVTAAILRNASIHNGTEDNSGAYQINLSSDQVKKGMWYLEGLRQGHLPGELLGYHLERLIHDASLQPSSEIQETDIFQLRDRYPLELQQTVDENGELTSLLTIIDGEKFLEQNEDEKFRHVKDQLNQIKDAAADIALCEVVDADDNVARRGGWLDFLEGESLPPREEFVRFRRTGDIHGTKVFMPILPPENLEATETVTNPRLIADPIFGHFCEEQLPDFGSKEIVAELTKIDGNQTRPITFFARELQMHPVDLVIGGLAELKLRTRYYLLSRWKAHDPADSASASPWNILGPFPDFARSEEPLNEVGVEIIPPLGSDDTLNIFNYIEKAKWIRHLFHHHRSKNSFGTVPPEELPIISPEQLSNLDPLAGFGLLSKRLRRLRDRLFHLISKTAAITSELKRRHLILQGLRECQRSLQVLQEIPGSGSTDGSPDQVIALLKTKVINLLDSDPDFGSLAERARVLEKIEHITNLETRTTIEIDNLTNQFTVLEKEFASYVENSASACLAQVNLLLLEISQFGLEKALTVLPEEPSVAASAKILKLFDQLIASLCEKVQPLIADFPACQNLINCLRVVYLYTGEVNETLLTNRGNQTETTNQLRNRLPLTEPQAQLLFSQPFKNTNYLETLLHFLFNELSSFSQTPTYYEHYWVSATIALITDPERVYNTIKSSPPDILNRLMNTYRITQRQAEILLDYKFEDIGNFDTDLMRERIVSATNSKIIEVIGLLQAATDNEGMVILTPYLLTEENNIIPEWVLDFSQLSGLTGPTYLQEYQKVRLAIANLLTLFQVGSDLWVYEDKRFQRIDPEESSFRKAGNTDYLYLATRNDLRLKIKSLAFLLVDQWQEGIPNPEGTELTGVALRYESPQAEAPNAIIIAVPPQKSNTDYWNLDLLANTLLETIELMQIRLVGSDEVIGNRILGKYLPALLFPLDKDGRPLFPSREKFLHGFDIGIFPGYVLASQLSKGEQSEMPVTARRTETPKIGD